MGPRSIEERPRQDDGRVHGVVGAVRDGSGRWLMIRRAAVLRIAPSKVCFPGGAVEAGERQEDAIAREMREELGLVVQPLRCVWRWESPSSPLTLFGWLVEVRGGQMDPDPGEVAEVLWLDAAEGSHHSEGLPTNPLFIARLEEAVRGG